MLAIQGSKEKFELFLRNGGFLRDHRIVLLEDGGHTGQNITLRR
jgi:hypothetical protein